MNGGQFLHGVVAGGDSIYALNGLLDNVNGFVCSTLGPNFAQIHIDDDNCPNGFLLPTAFHSMNDFCDCYNRASKQNKKCLTNAAVRVHLGLTGIIRVDALIEKCCARYGGNISKNLREF